MWTEPRVPIVGLVGGQECGGRRRLAESVSEYGRVAGGQGGRDARAAAWADQRRLQQERDASAKRARREGPTPPGGLGAVGATERMHTCVRGCGRLAACVTAADLAPRRRKRAPAACYWGCPGLCAVCSGSGAEGDLAADADGGASGGRDGGGAEDRGAGEAGAGAGLCGSCDEDGGEGAAADGGARRTRWTDSVLTLRAPAARAMRVFVCGHADARLLHARRPRGVG